MQAASISHKNYEKENIETKDKVWHRIHPA
jgi:hypothetical protein